MMKRMKYISINQPIGDLFMTKMNALDLNNISESDIRDSFNNTKGVQRKLSSDRVSSIAKYCKTGDAIFPTPIIISADRNYFNINYEESHIEYNENDIISNRAFCSIVDGQHRLKGIEKAKMLDIFELPVIVGIGLNKDQEIELFSTINGNQKPVNKSLLIDLYGQLDKKSIEKAGNTIVKVLNTQKDSYLKGKIKMLGVKESKDTQYVSQATLVDGFISLVSKDVKKDNLDLEKNEKLSFYHNEDEKFIFRNYIRNEQYKEISFICLSYFNSFFGKVNKYNNVNNNFFHKSIGFFAAFYFLRDFSKVISIDTTLKLDEQTKIFDEKLDGILKRFYTKSEFSYSSSLSGANQLYNDLKKCMD